jgi:intein/homing endonuclease
MDSDNQQILVKISDLEKSYRRYKPAKYIQNSLDSKLLPLIASPQLAQLCGHLIGDGNLRITNKAGGQIKFYGKVDKLLKIQKVYFSLFNKKIKLVERERESDPGYRLETTHSIVARCLNLIGVPSGDKIINSFYVPKWIIQGDIKIKRSFLQALFDDELEGLYRDKNRLNSWRGLRLRMNKCESLLPSGIIFFNQIKGLLDDLNIESSIPKIYPNISYIRKNGTKTYRLVIRIRNNYANRLRFYQELGFIYDNKKQQSLLASIQIIKRVDSNINFG